MGGGVPPKWLRHLQGQKSGVASKLDRAPRSCRSRNQDALGSQGRRRTRTFARSPRRWVGGPGHQDARWGLRLRPALAPPAAPSRRSPALQTRQVSPAGAAVERSPLIVWDDRFEDCISRACAAVRLRGGFPCWGEQSRSQRSIPQWLRPGFALQGRRDKHGPSFEQVHGEGRGVYRTRHPFGFWRVSERLWPSNLDGMAA